MPSARLIGWIHRLIRLAIGLAILALAITGPKTPWGLIGLIPIATAMIATCPLYSLLGISTCARRTADEECGN
jgi:hypothetical protein